MFLLHAKDLLLLFFILYLILNYFFSSLCVRCSLFFQEFIRQLMKKKQFFASSSYSDPFLVFRHLKKKKKREKTTSDRVTVISGRRTHSDDPLPRCDEISIGECLLSLSLISVNFSMFLSLSLSMHNCLVNSDLHLFSFLLYLNLEECNRQIFFLFAKSDEKEKNLIM